MPTETPDFAVEVQRILENLGVATDRYAKGSLAVHTPISGQVIGRVDGDSAKTVHAGVEAAHAAHLAWRAVPAPVRGQLVRLLGEELRQHKDELGRLVSIEVGKALSEGLGEVQEMIDICDFAVGLSRQLHGLTIATERADHRMMETWHPLGVVGIISAFNFPVAVWAWNATLALICGNTLVWKPSEKAPLCALAVQALFDRAADRFVTENGPLWAALSSVVIGYRDVGEALVDHPLVSLVSATGSTEMGRAVGQRLAARFGRGLLELGGNNAAIIAPSADLELALRGVAFSAMGTAGQRCTTLRRLFVHTTVYDRFVPRLTQIYRNVSIGNPLIEGNLVGPLIEVGSIHAMAASLEDAIASGGVVTGGDRVDVASCPDGYYVRPALVEMPEQKGPMLRETFAPILYVVRYDDLNDAIALNNIVSQGLSSSIFTTDVREAEFFLSARGSDCGIANVNIGTSGAEIGGAFGGEKETGGGRESGSDAWKNYMRRATNTINYGSTLPLAQGVVFDISTD